MRGKRQRRRRWRLRRWPKVLAVLVFLAAALLMATGSSPLPLPETLEKAEPAAPILLAGPPPRSPRRPAEPEPEPVILPLSQAVEDSWFAETVFLGDSRTEGFSLYSGLTEGRWLCAAGATVESVFTKPVQTPGTDPASSKQPLLDALAQGPCKRVYIMLGLNELGWSKPENYRDQYARVIARIREDHPEADIILQSLLPVSARQEARKTYVNNARIAVYNELLLALAEETGCRYLNAAEALTGADGCLPEDLNFDGIHLNPAGCAVWLDYLRTHTPQGD